MAGRHYTASPPGFPTPVRWDTSPGVQERVCSDSIESELLRVGNGVCPFDLSSTKTERCRARSLQNENSRKSVTWPKAGENHHLARPTRRHAAWIVRRPEHGRHRGHGYTAVRIGRGLRLVTPRRSAACVATGNLVHPKGKEKNASIACAARYDESRVRITSDSSVRFNTGHGSERNGDSVAD